MSDPTTTSENSPNPEASAPDDELTQAIRQRDEYLDQLQRTRAEFINYQKRSKAQADADRLYLIKPLAMDILNALDNFDRAIETARAGGAAGIAEGLGMVEKQFVAALNKHGVETIVALGQPFDPNFHEAIMQQPDAHHPEGTVVAEFAKGYKLNERVIRPSKVAVSVHPAE
ncbi:nucleotide exchange factor GrpE [Tundrisphaera lichenicola]|uniref:nucleotide exchange factor GrpE n=1 Tax=Tundrisphaera lichenicola TaxID=2029860 RepID=UPI003EBEFA8C